MGDGAATALEKGNGTGKGKRDGRRPAKQRPTVTKNQYGKRPSQARPGASDATSHQVNSDLQIQRKQAGGWCGVAGAGVAGLKENWGGWLMAGRVLLGTYSVLSSVFKRRNESDLQE